MGYEKIDNILDNWAVKHRLHLYKEYKDDEVRSIEKREGSRRMYQIWIDPPNENGLVGVHVWNFKKKRRDFLVPLNDLAEYLDLAVKIAVGWLH